MQTIFDIIILPFSWMMRLGYTLTGSYAAAILFFAAVSKAITFPLMLYAQKNSVRLLQLQPKIHHIKKQFAGERERINEEIYLLYKREKYSPLAGLLPLLIQLALLMCTVSVIRDTGKALAGLAYSTLFLGVDLSVIPADFRTAAMLSALSGAASYALCLVQNRVNPAQRTQPFWGRWGFSLVLIAFSAYFPIVMQGGVGLYWVYSNVLGIVAAFAVNAAYNPKKHVSAELLKPPQRISREEKAAQRQEKLRLRALEKEYISRYKAESEHDLVFYAISGGTYKYYSEVIEYILTNSNITIHYITNDSNDKLLQNKVPRLKAYYIGPMRIVSFMLNLDCKICVTTVMGLQNYQLKRSVKNLNIEYVYLFHAVSSTHLCTKKGSFDHYDTILCVGKHHIEEIRRTEQIYNLSAKKLVKCGYGVIDQITRLYSDLPPRNDQEKRILIAPSWSVDNILDSCLDEMVALLAPNYRIFIRPHPEYIKRFPEKWQAICAKHKNTPNVWYDDDFSSQDTIYQSDILITDWSNTAFEFSYATKRPSIFINTTMKVMNDEWERLGIEPIDLTLRSRLGADIDPNDLRDLPKIVEGMLAEPDKYRAAIDKAVGDYLYYPGRSGEAGGKYILSRLMSKYS